jgi:hypothetical protein
MPPCGYLAATRETAIIEPLGKIQHTAKSNNDTISKAGV